MYAGFVTHKHSVKRIGVHQRLDAAAYRMVGGYFAAGDWPPLKLILNFEGTGGPDDLKHKLPKFEAPNHFYNPSTGQGDLPASIRRHYRQLVKSLTDHDEVRSAFEASWLAHFVVDGLTPAHHQLPEEELKDVVAGKMPVKGPVRGVASGPGSIKTNWKIWIEKRVIPAHHNFEVGIAATLIGRPLRYKLDEAKLARAKTIGYLAFFKEEAAAIAKLDLYSEFREHGWNSSIAASVRHQVTPAAVQAVGIIWLLAYLEAGRTEVERLVATAV